MRNLILWTLLIIFLDTNSVRAQKLFTTTNIQSAYKNETRTLTGVAGKNYWQNRGDYTMKIGFDPATNILTGEETIAYYNNSPDSLKKLIIRLYPDLYKKGVERGSLFGAIKDEDLTDDGVSIDLLKIEDDTISVTDNSTAVFKNTNLIVTPANAILPKSKIALTIKWHYTVNIGSQIRTGRVDSGSYFIAYFFPRLAVYDDIDGWDTWSYNGTQEFYNDFGDFNVEIDLPKNYAVWATGERENAVDNFSQPVLDRLASAWKSDSIIHIIDSTDYINKNVFKPNATGKWIFSATNVTDFAFALSDHYLWDASSVVVDSTKTSKRRTLASAAYNKIHADYFDVANQAHQSVYYMSHFYPNVPFPFPQETVFDGTDQMEYPMMVNDNPTATHKDAVQLTSHEIFHSYFPFYMGINETQYAWMDEGWATIGESVISPKMGEREDEGIFSKTRYERIAATDRYVPLITNTKLYDGEAYLANSYGKAAICYWVLQDMLGDSLYFKALHTYMNNWHGKHPTPYDFFNSFNTGSKKDLDWFWQKWFYDLDYPDLAITSVGQFGSVATVTIVNKGGLPLPIYLSFTMDDSTTTTVHYPADTWNKLTGNIYSFRLKVKGKIKSATLGNDFIPDIEKGDNVWVSTAK
jgi:Peptidase family M1 domain